MPGAKVIIKYKEEKVIVDAFYEQYQHYFADKAKINLKNYLTPTEYRLLGFLWENRGKIVLKEVIMERVLADFAGVSDESLKWHLKNLRKKLRDLGYENIILCHKGYGYSFNKETLFNFEFD